MCHLIEQIFKWRFRHESFFNSKLHVFHHFHDVIVDAFILMRFIHDNSVSFERFFWLMISFFFRQCFMNVFVKTIFYRNHDHVCDFWMKYRRVFRFYRFDFKQKIIWSLQKLWHMIQFFRRIILFDTSKFHYKIVA